MGIPLRVLVKFIVVICFCVVPVIESCYLFGQVIPPVTGRVVDAVTVRPIQDISLTLQISTYEGFSVHTEVKSAATSDFSGSFSLPGVNHPAETPLNEVSSILADR
jgi:hypothetical protein